MFMFSCSLSHQYISKTTSTLNLEKLKFLLKSVFFSFTALEHLLNHGTYQKWRNEKELLSYEFSERNNLFWIFTQFFLYSLSTKGVPIESFPWSFILFFRWNYFRNFIRKNVVFRYLFFHLESECVFIVQSYS